MPRTRERSASPGRPPPIEAPPDAEQSMGSRLDAHQVARLTKTPLSRTPKTPTSKTPTKHDGTSKTPQRTPTKHSGDRTPTKHSGDGRSPLEKAGIESSVEAFSLSPAPSLYSFSSLSERTRVPPSHKLALKRARDRLLKDPATGKPYRWWSLCVPYSAFGRLGADAANYMRLLQEATAFALIGSVLAIVPMTLSSASPDASLLSMFAPTSIGAAQRVEWGHVVCDMLTTCLFAFFIHRWQGRALAMDKAGDMAGQHGSRFSDALHFCTAGTGVGFLGQPALNIPNG